MPSWTGIWMYSTHQSSQKTPVALAMAGSCVFSVQKNQLVATYCRMNWLTFQAYEKIPFLTVESPWLIHVCDHYCCTVGNESYPHLVTSPHSGPRSVANRPSMMTGPHTNHVDGGTLPALAISFRVSPCGPQLSQSLAPTAATVAVFALLVQVCFQSSNHSALWGRCGWLSTVLAGTCAILPFLILSLQDTGSLTTLSLSTCTDSHGLTPWKVSCDCLALVSSMSIWNLSHCNSVHTL